MNVASPSVLIMAGGTGGHVFPALAAAEKLRAKGVNVEWLGTRQGIEARVVPAADIPIHFIQVSGLRGKNLWQRCKAVWQVLMAMGSIGRLLRKLNPICVLGMGGFASGPGGLMAWMSRRPLIIHEQNAVAGTTNKLLERLASRVLLGYPISLGGSKACFVGNPVRESIANLPAKNEVLAEAKGPLKLLVLGGSLGSLPINKLVPEALALLPADSRPEVWHQTGSSHQETVTSDYQQRELDGRVEAFIDDMAAAYQWADLVICRAGALTVAELSVAGLPSILVPLPHAIDDHQTANAQWLADQNAAYLMPQKQLTASLLVTTVKELQDNRQQLAAMASAAKQAAKTDAAEQVATLCLEVANG